MEAGHLVSDDIILGVVRDELAKPEAAKGVIFDGVVRTIPQAEGVERLLARAGAADGRGAVLRCDRRGDPGPAGQAARSREQRADDDPAAVAHPARGLPGADRAGAGLVRGAERWSAGFPRSARVEEIADRVRQALGR